jgi:hypothetical protein
MDPIKNVHNSGQKSLFFRENFLVYKKGPKGGPEGEKVPEKRKGKEAVDAERDRVRAALETHATEERAKTGEKTAEDITSIHEQYIDKALGADFETAENKAAYLSKFIKRLPTINEGLDDTRVLKLLELCTQHGKTKDFVQIVKFIDLDIIDATKGDLSPQSIKLLLDGLKGDSEAKKELYEKIFSSTQTTEYFVIAFKNDQLELKKIYEKLEANGQLDRIEGEALNIIFTYAIETASDEDKEAIIKRVIGGKVHRVNALLVACKSQDVIRSIFSHITSSSRSTSLFGKVSPEALAVLFNNVRPDVFKEHVNRQDHANLMWASLLGAKSIDSNTKEKKILYKMTGLKNTKPSTIIVIERCLAFTHGKGDFNDKISQKGKEKVLERALLPLPTLKALWESISKDIREEQKIEEPGKELGVSPLVLQETLLGSLNSPDSYAVSVEQNSKSATINMVGISRYLPKGIDPTTFPAISISYNSKTKTYKFTQNSFGNLKGITEENISIEKLGTKISERIGEVEKSMRKIYELANKKIDPLKGEDGEIGLKDDKDLKHKEITELDDGVDSGPEAWKKHWKRISTFKQIQARLNSYPFNITKIEEGKDGIDITTASKDEVEKRTYELLEVCFDIGDHDDISFEDILENTGALKTITPLEKYNDKKITTVSEFKDYYEWLQGELKTGEKSTEYTTQLIKELGTMATIYDGCMQIRDMLVEAELMSDKTDLEGFVAKDPAAAPEVGREDDAAPDEKPDTVDADEPGGEKPADETPAPVGAIVAERATGGKPEEVKAKRTEHRATYAKVEDGGRAMRKPVKKEEAPKETEKRMAAYLVSNGDGTYKISYKEVHKDHEQTVGLADVIVDPNIKDVWLYKKGKKPAIKLTRGKVTTGKYKGREAFLVGGKGKYVPTWTGDVIAFEDPAAKKADAKDAPVEKPGEVTHASRAADLSKEDIPKETKREHFRHLTTNPEAITPEIFDAMVAYAHGPVEYHNHHKSAISALIKRNAVNGVDIAGLSPESAKPLLESVPLTNKKLLSTILLNLSDETVATLAKDTKWKREKIREKVLEQAETRKLDLTLRTPGDSGEEPKAKDVAGGKEEAPEKVELTKQFEALKSADTPEKKATAFAEIVKSLETVTAVQAEVLIAYVVSNFENNKEKITEFLKSDKADKTLSLIKEESAIKLLTTVASDEELLKKCASKLSVSTVNNILAKKDPSIPQGLKLAIHPNLKAIKKTLGLIYIEGEFRRSNSSESKTGKRIRTWKKGVYRFLVNEPNHIYYDLNGTTQRATYEKGKPIKNSDWTKVEGGPKAPTLEAAEVSEKAKGIYLETSFDASLFDETGKQLSEVPARTKIVAVGTTVKLIHGRKYIEVQVNKSEKTGWIEEDLVRTSKPSAEVEAMNSDTKALYEKYFITFDNVELTTRKINRGQYQLRIKTNLYQETGATSVDPQNGKLQYFIIGHPEIYKLTNGDKVIYVAKAEGFHDTSPTDPILSSSELGKSGYIDVTRIIQGWEKSPATPTAPSIESAWSEEAKTTADSDLIVGKEYKVPPTKGATTFLLYKSHSPEEFTTKHKVTVVKAEKRVVEDIDGQEKEYVLVKVVGTSTEGWILRSVLEIPEEDTIFIDPAKTPDHGPAFNKLQDKEFRKGIKIDGVIRIKGVIRGNDLLNAVARAKTDIIDKLVKSGISNADYVKILDSAREGNKINIVEPSAELMALLQNSMDPIMAAYKGDLANSEFKIARTAREIHVMKTREDYYENASYLSDDKLADYVGSEREWNDLWANRNEQKGEFIDGLDRLESVMKKFKFSDLEVRDNIRELLAIGWNDKVTFQEIFNRFCKGRLYKNGKSNFQIFKKEIDTLETKTNYWFHTSEGVGNLVKLSNFEAMGEQYAVKQRRADAEGREWQNDPFKLEYDRIAVEMKPIVDKAKEDQLWKSAERLAVLQNTVLFPIADLLDTLSTLKVGTFEKVPPTTVYAELLKTIPEVAGLTYVKPQPHILNQVMDRGREGELDLATDKEHPENYTKIGIAPTAFAAFNEIAKDYSDDKFTTSQVNRIIFKLYSLETLVREGCLAKRKDKDKDYIIIKLPSNFTKANSAVKQLFTKLEDEGNDIDDIENAFFEEISKSLDKNAETLQRVIDIFGMDEGSKVNLRREDIIDLFSDWFGGADFRETTITMSDIANKKATFNEDEFLRRYMSEQAATAHVLQEITSYDGHIETYDGAKLTTMLIERANFAIDNLDISPRLAALKKHLVDTYGSLDKAKTAIATILANPTAEIPKEIKSLIRAGEVFYRMFEENKETIAYSGNKSVKKVQEELIAAGYPKDKVGDIEDFFVAGIGFQVGGAPGVGLSIPIYSSTPTEIGSAGWTFKTTTTAQIGVSTTGVGGGVTQSFAFSSPEGVTINLAISGGVLYVVGSGGVSFPISDKWDMNLHGFGGVVGVLPIAGGGIGFKKVESREQEIEWKKEQGRLGIEAAVELMDKGQGGTKMLEAIFAILPTEDQKIGQRLKQLYDSNQLTAKGVMDIFKMFIDEWESHVNETKLGGEGFVFEIDEFVIGAGIVGPVPFVYAGIGIKVGEEYVIVRQTVPGYKQTAEVSDAKIEEALKKAFEKRGASGNISLYNKISETGSVIYDAQSGEIVHLDRTNSGSVAYSKDGGLSDFQASLAKNKIDLSSTSDGLLHLQARQPKATPGLIKYIVDPKINDIVKINPSGGVTLATDSLSDLIITREDYHYPAPKLGATNHTYIVIKSNPMRSRQMIEEESTHLVVERSGYKPELVRGEAMIRTESYKGNVLSPEDFEKRKESINTLVFRVEGQSSEYNTKLEQTVASADRSDFDNPPRNEFKGKKLTAFSRKFLQKYPKKYRELSTLGQTTYDIPALNELINQFAAAEGIDLKTTPINNNEMNLIHLSLMRGSFMNARQSKAIFKKNLEFARTKVYPQAFAEANKVLGITSDPQAMADRLCKSIAEGFDPKSTDFKTFEEGALFFSAVGTKKIVGLRGSTYYQNLGGGIINFKEFDPSSNGIDGDIGKALLQILSPLDLNVEDAEIMKAPLAIKLAKSTVDGDPKIPTLFYLIGVEDSLKVADCFVTGKVEEKNKKAFDKFKKILKDIRDAQNGGKNYLMFGKYKLSIETTVGAGGYDKCTNTTIAGEEKLILWEPAGKGTTTGSKTFVPVSAKTIKRDIRIFIGVKVDIPNRPPPPPEGGDKSEGIQESTVAPEAKPDPVQGEAPGQQGGRGGAGGSDQFN